MTGDTTGAVSRRPEAEEAVRLLLRHWIIILACAIAAGGAALGLSLSQTPLYSASAQLLFRNPALDSVLFGSIPVRGTSDPAREASTNVKLASLPNIASNTARALGESITPREIEAAVSVASAGESDVVVVTATDPSANQAARIANEFASQFVDFRRNADRAKVNSALDLVQRQLDSLDEAQRRGPEGTSLQGQADQLRVLASLQTGNAELVQEATAPSAPSSPRTYRNTALAAILGLVAGSVLVLLRARFDRTVRDASMFGELYDLPVLATVSHSASLAAGERELGPVEGEAIAMLRTRLRFFNVDRDISTILMTSAVQAEGKTTIAWHLAMSVGASGATVLLVEADLRRPSLASRFRLRASPGMAEILTHVAEADDVKQSIPVGSSALTEGDGRRRVDVIVAGTIPPNPAELVESDQMESFLREQRARYDLIVIDSPPLLSVSETTTLLSRVEGALIVSRVGKTRSDAAQHAAREFRRLKAPTLGVVVNDQRRGGVGYGYGYGAPSTVYDESSPQHGSRRAGKTSHAGSTR